MLRSDNSKEAWLLLWLCGTWLTLVFGSLLLPEELTNWILASSPVRRYHGLPFIVPLASFSWRGSAAISALRSLAELWKWYGIFFKPCPSLARQFPRTVTPDFHVDCRKLRVLWHVYLLLRTGDTKTSDYLCRILPGGFIGQL